MNQGQRYTILLVFSTNHALKAEKALEKAGIPCKLIPVPRYISSECGVCVRVSQEDTENAFLELRSANLDIAGFHDIYTK